MNETMNSEVPVVQPRRVRRWVWQNVSMLCDEAVAITEGAEPHRKAKWRMIPYELPDGKKGQWWQPWKPVRYKAFDFTHVRARKRLARVYSPNDQRQATASTKQ
jgi:ABC-type antimicrobial peptide transport system ATPase subunit